MTNAIYYTIKYEKLLERYNEIKTKIRKINNNYNYRYMTKKIKDKIKMLRNERNDLDKELDKLYKKTFVYNYNKETVYAQAIVDKEKTVDFKQPIIVFLNIRSNFSNGKYTDKMLKAIASKFYPYVELQKDTFVYTGEMP